MIKVMTVDVETDWEGPNTESVAEIVPRILDYFQQNGIQATFFVLGEVAEKNPEIIKEIAKKHEVGSHSYSHANMQNLSREETEKSIKKSVDILKKNKIECKGFRAPFFKKNRFTDEILEKHGFLYDSSETGTMIRKKNSIFEIPVPNRIPFVRNGLSYHRLFYPFSAMLPNKNLFYMHPYEFTEKVGNANFMLKTIGRRNRGQKAWMLFDRFMQKQDAKWVSCQTYLKKNEAL